MSISWFLLVNKPLDFTSFDVIAVLRKKLWVKKIWHTWTLDPLATGLMLVWVWDGCKFIYLHNSDKKSYEATVILWKVSETYDWEWPIKSTWFTWEVSKQQLLEVFEWFKWKIKQTPPKYSAIKIEWRKLCDIARKWEEVDIPEREVEIFKINLISFKFPEFKLEVDCSSWTYIRSIASDVWKRLWTWAYLSWLVRTKIEDIDLNDAYNLEEISSKSLLSLDYWLDKIEKIDVESQIIERLKFGHRISLKDLVGVTNKQFWEYRIYCKWNFHWIWEIRNWILKWKRIV